MINSTATPAQLHAENHALREQLYFWQQHARHYKARATKTTARVRAKAAHPAGKTTRTANNPWSAKETYETKP